MEDSEILESFVTKFYKSRNLKSFYNENAFIYRQLPKGTFYGNYEQMHEYIVPKGTESIKVYSASILSIKEDEKEITIQGLTTIDGVEYSFSQIFSFTVNRRFFQIQKDTVTVIYINNLFEPIIARDFTKEEEKREEKKKEEKKREEKKEEKKEEEKKEEKVEERPKKTHYKKSYPSDNKFKPYVRK